MADESSRPVRLMNFVSQDQLDEAKKTRGERVEDGTAQRDRPLFEILKENKDKRDAEFNERFKHRPPKALDEDETEFLHKLDQSKREYEQQVAVEDAQQIRSFQAAVAARSMMVHEIKETPAVNQEQKLIGKKNPPPPRPIGMIIKVKPQAKKAKLDQECITKKNIDVDVESKSTSQPTKVPNEDAHRSSSSDVVKTSLVEYSDESEEDD